MLTLYKRPESTQISKMELFVKMVDDRKPFLQKAWSYNRKSFLNASELCYLRKHFVKCFWIMLVCLLFFVCLLLFDMSVTCCIFSFIFSVTCVFCYFFWYFLIFAFFWEGICLFSFFFGLMSFVLSCVSLFTYFSLSF